MFIQALVAIIKIWKQLKCPLMSDCMKKIWFIYAVEYFSAMRKNCCHLKPHRSEGHYGHYAKCDKAEKDKYHVLSLICGISKC